MSRDSVATGDVGAAIASFVHGGAGPAHSRLSQAFVAAGVGDDYRYDPDGRPGPNKEQRVLSAFSRVASRGSGRRLVEGLLSSLRHDGLIAAKSESVSEDESRLLAALGRAGWSLNSQGGLRAKFGPDLDTGGRAALDETMERLRGSGADPALSIGTAKEMLEAVAKFVLEELGMPTDGMKSFNQLFHVARERLGILPQHVDKGVPGYEQIRAIHQSSWSIAENVNELRNLQGTGHGRTLPSGVSEELAMLVVREACSVAEYMLRLLDSKRS